MKRILLVLVLALVVFGLSAQVKVSGDTGGTVYHDTGTVGVFDSDQNVLVAWGPLSLAGNVGFTHDFGANLSTLSWGYALKANQAFGPVTLYGALQSDSMSIPRVLQGYVFGEKFSGDILDDIVVGADFALAPIAVNAYALMSEKAGYQFLQGIDVSAAATFGPATFRVGGLYLDPQAVTDGVGYTNAVAAIQGISFYAKAKVSY
jgi:hypothetical protein